MRGMDLRDWRRIKELGQDGPVGMHHHDWIFKVSREDYIRYRETGAISAIWDDMLEEGIPLPDEVIIFRNMTDWEDMSELVKDIIWFNELIEEGRGIVEKYNSLFKGDKDEPRS